MASPPKSLPDRVVPGAPGESIDFWIYSVSPKGQWRPRATGNLTRADHPGSAISYEDKLYELISADETGEWGYSVRYGLREWDSAYAIRTRVFYTPEAEAAAAAAHRAEAETVQLRKHLLWLFPLAGLVPESIQNQWGVATGLNMGWISAGSALFFLALALSLIGVTEYTHFFFIVVYLGAESFVRLLLTANFRRPWGALWVKIPYDVWQIVSGGQSGTSRETAAALLSIMTDEIIRGPGVSALQVSSAFYDTDLTGDIPVRIEGAFYQPRRRHKQGKGLQRRWLYELEKMEGAPSGRWHEFIRPRKPARQKAVEEYTHAYDMANSFALFWGFYPRSDQVRLHLLYEYEGAKSTAISAAIFLILALFQTGITVIYGLSVIAIAGSAYFIVESVYRLYRAQVRHEPAGSIIGYIFRLVIRPPK